MHINASPPIEAVMMAIQNQGNQGQLSSQNINVSRPSLKGNLTCYKYVEKYV